MENIRILNLKKALFYYLFSWRLILLCIILCVTLLLSFAYLRPETRNEAILEQQEKLLTEKKNQFISEDKEATKWATQITTLEEELSSLENELLNSLFLQINPEHRINKHFTLRFTYFMVDFKDAAEKTRADQMLCLQYMKQLSGDSYMNYLATKGLLKFSPDSLVSLVDMTLKEEGYIEFMVTGPEEVIVDQLIMTTKDYLERVVRPEIDLLATHFLTFGETTKEVVKDPSVVLLKNKIKSEISIKEDKIDELNQMIDNALEESLQEAGLEIPESDVSVRPNPNLTLKKNIVLGLMLGLIVSALVTAVRYRRQIIKVDVKAIAQENNIPHLGIVSYFSEKAKRRSKCFCSFVDRFIIRLFGMTYNVEEATSQTDYVAQVFKGIVNARIMNEEHPHIVDILIPYVKDDASAEALVVYIRKTLEQNDGIKQINLIEGGNLEYDPDTVEAVRESSGLLLLSKSSDSMTTLADSIHRGSDLSKEILGVIEMHERW